MAYIGKSPDGTGVRSRFYYTQTSGGGTSVSGSSDDGTSLAFSDGAYVDVFLNGVLLVAGTDYNTTTANTIAGLAALAAGDVVEVVVYDIFTVADTVSSLNGGTFSNSVTIDKDGGTALTVDRATSDGTIIDVQKDGSTIGSIGTVNSLLFVGTGDTGIKFHDTDDNVRPASGVDGSGRDNAIDLGSSTNRFKDAYLGGGLYVGGTVSANHLDDYEEGTFTPAIGGVTSGAVSYGNRFGAYTKIGQIVHAYFFIEFTDNTATAGNLQVHSLPFTASNLTYHFPEAAVLIDNLKVALNNPLIQVANNTAQAHMLTNVGSTGTHAAMSIATYVAGTSATINLRASLTYRTG